MGTKRYGYTLLDDGGSMPEEGVEPDYTLTTTLDLDNEEDHDLLATECAEDYHNNHDGWEAQWPIRIALRVLGVWVGVYNVTCESVPVFSAEKAGA